MYQSLWTYTVQTVVLHPWQMTPALGRMREAKMNGDIEVLRILRGIALYIL
jgi:hypothetical protein